MYEYNEMIDRLKAILDARKISIKQLSELADVPYRTLYKIITKETKEPSVNVMIKIARALNITTDKLVFGNSIDAPTYIIGENGEREVRYTDTDASNNQNRDALLEEMGIKQNTNYIMSKENVKTELTDNEYDFLVNSLGFYRNK